MDLDVLVPTYNRAEMLERTLVSLCAADRPTDLTVRITVVDNNSVDRTSQTVTRYAARGDMDIQYVFERQQGRSHALNAGIAVSHGDLVGMVDDDEEVDPDWFKVIYSVFTQLSVDFVGGPYLPKWSVDPPDWLPPDYHGVIGWVDGGNRVLPYDERYPGILMGGNAVIKRSMLTRVGPYSPWLGRAGGRLLCCEDEEMYRRLLDAGARGLYVPSLIIYHYIPAERLTRRYFRRWCFWRGVSRAVLDKSRPEPVTYLGQVPRYLYGRVLRGLLRLPRRLVARSPERAAYFSDELAFWDLAGFVYGRHLHRP